MRTRSRAVDIFDACAGIIHAMRDEHKVSKH